MRFTDVEHAFYSKYPEGLICRNINNFENRTINNSYSIKYSKTSKLYKYNDTIEGLYTRLNLNDEKLDAMLKAKNDKHEAWKKLTKWNENEDEF